MCRRRARLAVAEELPRFGHRHREHLADVAAAEAVFEHRRLESLALAVLAGGGDAGHHRQVGVDDAGAVAGRAGALGVGAEQRRLHAVGLRERAADRVEQPVYVAGLLRREPPIAPWSTDTTPVNGGIEPVDERLLPEPATPVTTTSTPSGMSTSTLRRLWVFAPRILSVPVGFRTVF